MSIYDEDYLATLERPKGWTARAQKYVMKETSSLVSDPGTWLYRRNKQVKGLAAAGVIKSGYDYASSAYEYTKRHFSPPRRPAAQSAKPQSNVLHLAEPHHDKGLRYERSEVISNVNETRASMRNESNATAKSEL